MRHGLGSVGVFEFALFLDPVRINHWTGHDHKVAAITWIFLPVVSAFVTDFLVECSLRLEIFGHGGQQFAHSVWDGFVQQQAFQGLLGCLRVSFKESLMGCNAAIEPIIAPGI